MVLKSFNISNFSLIKNSALVACVNLEKYVITNEKFNMLINGKSNSVKHSVVQKIVKFLHTYESLPQNIIIFTESKQFAKKIKKICVGHYVHCYNTKVLKNTNYSIFNKKIISNSLIISECDYFDIQSFKCDNTKFIVLNSHFLKDCNKDYNIILNYCELNTKNEYTECMSDELYNSIVNKFNNVSG